jgi:hypothetical protein
MGLEDRIDLLCIRDLFAIEDACRRTVRTDRPNARATSICRVKPCSTKNIIA